MLGDGLVAFEVGDELVVPPGDGLVLPPPGDGLVLGEANELEAGDGLVEGDGAVETSPTLVEVEGDGLVAD